MTTITLPTTPGTIKATTLEGWIFQLAQTANIYERDANKNLANVSYVAVAIDQDFVYDTLPTANAGKATITISDLPIDTITLPFSNAKSSITVADYLTSSGYSVGSSGTPTFSITSSTWCQHLWDGVQLLHKLQIDPAKNTYGIQPVTAISMTGTQSGSLKNMVGSATVELPIKNTLNATTGFYELQTIEIMGALS